MEAGIARRRRGRKGHERDARVVAFLVRGRDALATAIDEVHGGNCEVLAVQPDAVDGGIHLQVNRCGTRVALLARIDA